MEQKTMKIEENIQNFSNNHFKEQAADPLRMQIHEEDEE